MTLRARVALMVAVLAVVGLLAACSGGTPSGGSPASGSHASSTEAPSASATALAVTCAQVGQDMRLADATATTLPPEIAGYPAPSNQLALACAAKSCDAAGEPDPCAAAPQNYRDVIVAVYTHTKFGYEDALQAAGWSMDTSSAVEIFNLASSRYSITITDGIPSVTTPNTDVILYRDLQPTGTATGTAPTSAAPPTVTQPTDSYEVSMAGNATDEDGYSYHIKATVTVGRPHDGDSSGLPPGTSEFLVPMSGDLNVDSTTPGKRADGFPYGMELVALYKQPSPLCAGDNNGLLSNKVDGRRYCTIVLGDFGGLTDFPVGGAIDSTMTVSDCSPFGCQKGAATTDDATAYVYKDSAIAAARKAVTRKPDALLVVVTSPPQPGKGSRVCALGTGVGSWVVASSPAEICR